MFVGWIVCVILLLLYVAIKWITGQIGMSLDFMHALLAVLVVFQLVGMLVKYGVKKLEGDENE